MANTRPCTLYEIVLQMLVVIWMILGINIVNYNVVQWLIGGGDGGRWPPTIVGQKRLRYSNRTVNYSNRTITFMFPV